MKVTPTQSPEPAKASPSSSISESRPRTPGKKSPRKTETVDRLIEAAFTTLRTHGIAGTSARTVAATAQTNQGLIFYHFGSMEGLLAEACRRSTERRVMLYRDRFAEVSSLRQLLSVGREIHASEQAKGNVAVLAQLLAAGQTDPVLGEVTAQALNQWVAQIETVLERLLSESPLGEMVDAAGLSRAVAASFVGLELFEGVAPAEGALAIDALDQLGALVEVVEGLGPVGRQAMRMQVKRSQRRSS
ncbi:TetR family transcriptional regulator [Kineosporia sp. NBRC 101677]|nr:TetR family transcriptional regulator [Kineosporia sp. NBRC 101677]